MQIHCPVCAYTREADVSKIPPTAEFATCPKCHHRFKFRALDLETIERPEPEGPKAEHADVWEAMDSLHDRWQEKDRQDRHEIPEEEGDEEQESSHYTHVPPDDVAIPWENPGYLGYLQSFLRTTTWVLLQPFSFFATLSRRPALFPALTFYLIFGFFQYLCRVLWTSVLGNMMREDFIRVLGEEMFTQTVEKAVENFILTPAILAIPFGLAIQLVATVAVVHLLVRIMAPKAADFALTFKVVSYASAAFIVTAVPIAGIFLGPVAYFIFLLLGCRHAFRLPWTKAALALIPLYLFMILAASGQYGQFLQQ